MTARNQNDRQLSPAYAEYLKDKQAELDAEKAAEEQKPENLYRTAANTAAQAVRQSIIDGTPLGEDVLPGERVAGRKVEEKAGLSNWKWWATNTGKDLGFKKHMTEAVNHVCEHSDLAPTAHNFTAAFQLLKDYDLLPDREPGSPDYSAIDSELSKLGLGQPARDIDINLEQISKDFDTFIATGWKRSNLNAQKLIAELNRLDLVPVLANLKIVAGALKASNSFPEPTESTPREISEAKYKARLTEIVVYDPLDNKGYTEFDLENKVDSKTELRLRRLMEGRIGNEQYEEFLNRKDYQVRQAAERDRIAAEEK